MVRVISIVILSLIIQGCSTLVHGNRQDVLINTSVPGATVNVSGQTLSTPAVASLQRNKDHTVVVSRKGYQDAKIMVRKVVTFNDLLLLVPGNGLITAFFGIFVDYFTESIGSLEPNVIDVTLKK
jgi:hypothetical protein